MCEYSSECSAFLYEERTNNCHFGIKGQAIQQANKSMESIFISQGRQIKMKKIENNLL